MNGLNEHFSRIRSDSDLFLKFNNIENQPSSNFLKFQNFQNDESFILLKNKLNPRSSNIMKINLNRKKLNHNTNDPPKIKHLNIPEKNKKLSSFESLVSLQKLKKLNGNFFLTLLEDKVKLNGNSSHNNLLLDEKDLIVNRYRKKSELIRKLEKQSMLNSIKLKDKKSFNDEISRVESESKKLNEIIISERRKNNSISSFIIEKNSNRHSDFIENKFYVNLIRKRNETEYRQEFSRDDHTKFKKEFNFENYERILNIDELDLFRMRKVVNKNLGLQNLKKKEITEEIKKTDNFTKIKKILESTKIGLIKIKYKLSQNKSIKVKKDSNNKDLRITNV